MIRPWGTTASLNMTTNMPQEMLSPVVGYTRLEDGARSLLRAQGWMWPDQEEACFRDGGLVGGPAKELAMLYEVLIVGPDPGHLLETPSRMGAVEGPLVETSASAPVASFSMVFARW